MTLRPYPLKRNKSFREGDFVPLIDLGVHRRFRMAKSTPRRMLSHREEQEEELEADSADLEILREGRQQERGRLQDLRLCRGLQQAEHG